MNTNDQAGPFWSERLYVRIPRRDIALFKFLLESYENLALLTVLDRYEAVVQLRFSPDQVQEVRQVLDGIRQEIELNLLDLPPLNRPLSPGT